MVFPPIYPQKMILMTKIGIKTHEKSPFFGKNRAKNELLTGFLVDESGLAPESY